MPSKPQRGLLSRALQCSPSASRSPVNASVLTLRLQRNRNNFSKTFTMAGVDRGVLLTLSLTFLGSTVSSVFALRQPNIILLVTDDQDGHGVIPMKKTQQLIANIGATFTNAFVSTPLCCPSRSSMLTGRYLHNTKVVNNSLSGGCSGPEWQKNEEQQTFAKYLHEKGYVTFYAGKYLNQYGRKEVGGLKHIPPSWDWWVGLKGNSRYYDYSLSINGSAKYFRDDYLTDVLASYATDFLRMQQKGSKSFLMVIAPPAPHSPYTPAKRHKNLFQNESVPRTPNFNPGPQSEKHWLLRVPPSHLSDSLISRIDEYWRLRWCTLLAVDELVEQLVQTLKYQGLLDNTYFIVTSDNGYHLGHYGLPWDKRQPYDTDIRIPLLVRGPGVPRRKTLDAPILLLDVAPTIIEMAGASLPTLMDGTSFLPLLKRKGKMKRSGKNSRTFLVEYRGEGNVNSVDPKCSWRRDDTLSNCEIDSACKCQDARNNSYDCFRSMNTHNDFQFCVFADDEKFIEAYDLRNDPYQMNNIADKLGGKTVRKYNALLSKLTKCRGTSCHLHIGQPKFNNKQFFNGRKDLKMRNSLHA